MDINACIAQLKANAPFFAGNVAGGAGLSNVLDKAPTTGLPWAFVIPLGADAEANTSWNGIDQDVTERVGVVVILNNAASPADRRGQAAAAAYQIAKVQIWSSLLNWNPQPDICSRPLQYVSDELVQQDTARAVYEFVFSQPEVHITEADGWQGSYPPLVEFDLNILGFDGGNVTTIAVPGPDGTVSTPTPLLAGAGGISGDRVLMPDGMGNVIHADPTNPAYSFAGISTAAAAAGQPVSLVLDGPMIEPSWAWPVQAALYAGSDGTLVTTPPTSGISQQLASTISPTTIYVSPSAPITLA